MKNTTKTLSMILLASISGKALEKPILVSHGELRHYEQQKNLQGLEARLVQSGILVQTNKKEIYIFNDLALSKIEDEKVLSLLSDLIQWLTDGSIKLEPKNWKEMILATQDYSGDA